MRTNFERTIELLPFVKPAILIQWSVPDNQNAYNSRGNNNRNSLQSSTQNLFSQVSRAPHRKTLTHQN